MVRAPAAELPPSLQACQPPAQLWDSSKIRRKPRGEHELGRGQASCALEYGRV